MSVVKPGARYCGRHFTAVEIEWIRRVISANPSKNRVQLSRMVCDEMGWRRPNGGLKEMSCRVAMLRMERDGLLRLPPPQRGNGNGRNRPVLTSASDPGKPCTASVDALGEVSTRAVRNGRESSLWNELIERYHYLGYKPLPGAQMRYLAWGADQVLAAIGFGASAWALAPRDNFIGWTVEGRTRNLQRVINNARFLIVPWVKSPNLASRLLALLAKRLPQDWDERYGYRPVLMETFVQRDRFVGTCYRAANWISVGQTQGRGKIDRKHRHDLPVKEIFLYPLDRNFRRVLCSSR